MQNTPKAPNAEAFIQQQKQAIASNPDCGNSHYNLGVALMGQGKIEEAEKSLLSAIECSPGLAEAYVQMGGICLKRGDIEGCLSWNQRAVKTKPGFSEGWGNIGFVLLQQGCEQVQVLDSRVSFPSGQLGGRVQRLGRPYGKSVSRNHVPFHVLSSKELCPVPGVDSLTSLRLSLSRPSGRLHRRGAAGARARA